MRLFYACVKRFYLYFNLSRKTEHAEPVVRWRFCLTHAQAQTQTLAFCFVLDRFIDVTETPCKQQDSPKCM